MCIHIIFFFPLKSDVPFPFPVEKSLSAGRFPGTVVPRGELPVNLCAFCCVCFLLLAKPTCGLGKCLWCLGFFRKYVWKPITGFWEDRMVS